jgi:DNA-binding GntR family transcriptional regulator
MTWASSSRLVWYRPAGLGRRAGHRWRASWSRIRARIEAGEFRPGEDPLPSEKDIVQLFGVARDTARRAVQVLRDEGLVVTVPQRGTYVVERG